MDLNKIKTKLDELEFVKGLLKNKFIGIDNIIDEFIDNVKIWYACPELQMRPFILNLWGMTGVGKTDLVRTFVKLINFNDKFIELQMDNLDADNNYGEKSIQYKLELVLDNTDDHSILLLDEMQRFKTIDEMGNDLPKNENDKYSDVWSLLSDGKFTNDASYKKKLFDLYFSMLYILDSQKNEEFEEEKPKKKNTKNSRNINQDIKIEKNNRTYKTHYLEASRLKKILKLDESIDVIMKWDDNKILMIIEDALKVTNVRESPVYKNMLIIISGNLDEAYHMADEIDSIDVDADVYHEYSKKITMIDIKESLSKRFKPEQIARFGNVHLIYPSLDKKTYNIIIKNKCKEIAENVKKNANIDIEYDQSVYDTIYRNGVFPTQGVRPLLSTISSLLENSLPFFIYTTLTDSVYKIKLYSEDSNLYIINNNKKINYKLNLVIDNIKKDNSYDMQCNIAVHEVGHAIAYMQLFNIVPIQLICSTASSFTNGFLMPHMSKYSRDILINEIIVSMAGVAAEEIIFSENNRGTGSTGDIHRATKIASDIVRNYGMNQYNSHILIVPSADNGPSYGILNEYESSKHVETIINECKVAATSIIKSKMSLLKELTTRLLDSKTLKPESIYEISKKYYDNLHIKDSSFTITENYRDMMLNKFKEIE